MTENYFDAKKVKKTRGASFMNRAREIKEVPPQTLKPKQKEEKPIKTKEKIEKKEDNETKDQVVLEKGFIVGYTNDGKVLFKPIGSPSKMEIVGLVEYAKTISKDILHEIANTKINMLPSIKDGIAASLKATHFLITNKNKEEE